MKNVQKKSRTNILFTAVFCAALLFSGRANAFFGLFFGGAVFEPTSTAAELTKNISTKIEIKNFKIYGDNSREI